jgi:toxin ParE1/3/4
VSYRLSPLARQDLDDLWLYVAVDAGVKRADKLVDAIVERFAMLATHPKAGKVRPDLADDLRSFYVEKHFVYYREEADSVRIVRVLQASRDQASAWRQSPESGEQD